MDNVFYFFALFAILFEASVMVRTKDFFALKQEMLVKGSKNYNDTEKAFALLTSFYAIWAILGLFSSQWPGFLALLILSILPMKRVKMGFYIDAAVSLLILLFIVINKYHFHFNLTESW
jgi:hypothetical protein